MIRAVGFDLDDTLYDHSQYVRGAYRDVAAAVERVTGISADEFFERIFPDWQRRTSRCDRIFADALRDAAVYSLELERELVGIYRAHHPTLTAHPGVREGLDSLRAAGIRLGLLSDGQLAVQQRKLRTLNLTDCFDACVFTGALGRDFYKPHDAGFVQLANALNVRPEELVYVGDNPFTDFDAPRRLGITTIRVLTGEYREHEPALASVCHTFTSVALAMEWLLTATRSG
ncbi:MAG TPA: HAD-IA family hydrolase [Candidatus Binatia bacterium]|nr:HAD-IA family hydrolase [Candidatus Binatia bacterium]